VDKMILMSNQEFYMLTAYIKRKFGVHLGLEKKTLVQGRLHKIIANMNCAGVKEYYEYLINDRTGQADVELVNAITTNHTFFMRESSHFECFSEQVLPYLYKKVQDRNLRIWCAACSTGEEAYTLAMLINDFFSIKSQGWDTKLLATDICLNALDIARQGIYSADSLSNIPKKWKNIYFKKQDENEYQVIPLLKNEVIYRQFNLINGQFPFKKKFHTIFCRNVMIYFDVPTRQALVRKFYDYLEPGGYLFIGHSEVLDHSNAFKCVMPAVYRKE
jgi:chemotaxis protein methyltransferase CheR